LIGVARVFETSHSSSVSISSFVTRLVAIARVDDLPSSMRCVVTHIVTCRFTLATIHDSFKHGIVTGKVAIATPIFTDFACGSVTRSSVAVAAEGVSTSSIHTRIDASNGTIGISKVATDTVDIALGAFPTKFP
jgi:hypothetical protein